MLGERISWETFWVTLEFKKHMFFLLLLFICIAL